MELFRKIDREKIQFGFVTFPGERGPLYGEIHSLGGKVFESPKYSGLNHAAYVFWWHSFLKKHPEYQVVHGHVRSVASIYLPIIRRHHRFAIIHSHNTSNGSGVKAYVKAVLQWPIRFLADYYFGCSDDAGRWLFGEKLVQGKRYRTIPNAIDARRFSFDSGERDRVRKKYRWENSFVLGHIGRLAEVKNHEFLFEILKELRKYIPNAVLLCVGEGERRADLERICREREIQDSVFLVGNKKNTEDFYQAMDVFVLPSKWEGLPIVLVEAQTNGLPVLVPDYMTSEADLGAGLMHRMKLESGAAEWAKTIVQLAKKIDRHSRERECREAGFDSRKNAKVLQRFYTKAAGIVRKKQ
ncbi:MAG: glycosyltransferase [Lachnospiraceae bacterium]|nr:glycosyltransferase [Lachnospiraceae bacterium]